MIADMPKTFPTGVGMNRFQLRFFHVLQYVPHRRGDEPEAVEGVLREQKRSPQA